MDGFLVDWFLCADQVITEQLGAEGAFSTVTRPLKLTWMTIIKSWTKVSHAVAATHTIRRFQAMKNQTRQSEFEKFRAQWQLMSLFERFEQVIAVLLSTVIAVIIIA
ncbi:MAG: hypothetical protein ACP5GF_11020, partial [Thiomonas sp.]